MSSNNTQQQQPHKARVYKMRDAAAMLNTGQNRLVRWLQDHKYIHKDTSGNILPARQYVEAGYLVAKMHWVKLGGTDITILRASTRVTEKGMAWLQKKLDEERAA